jgi:MFS superfamily sulfate permease-like transporter
MVIGVATSMAGAMILVAGLTRLGFLDNVLSRPFLRGFITAIGFVIFVDQLIPELGLADPAQESGASHGTTVQKLAFVARNIQESHVLTAMVSVVSFAVIMIFRCVPKACSRPNNTN